MQSQNELILKHLKRKCITPLEALKKYGIFRLGGRIYELKQRGHDIRTTMIETGGKRVARYRLVA